MADPYGDFATEAEKFAEDIRSLKRPKTEPGDDGVVAADQDWLARAQASSDIGAVVRAQELLHSTYVKGEVDASAAEASWDVKEEVDPSAVELNFPEEAPSGLTQNRRLQQVAPLWSATMTRIHYTVATTSRKSSLMASSATGRKLRAKHA